MRITEWLTRLDAVQVATTREEREAIYRFRYTIYVEEFGRELGAPDHERKMLYDEDDEKDYTTLLYTGKNGEVHSTVRLRHWEPGEIPHHEREELSMDLLPDIDERRVAEIGRFMIRRSLRGKLTLASLARYAYHLLAGEKQTELAFCYCAPGLVRYYRKLGARPFGGRLVHTVDGMMVPLVSVMSDHQYFKSVGSPMAPLVRQYFGRGQRPPVDMTPYLHLFESSSQTVELDSGKVWQEVEDAFLDEGEGKSPTILDSLTPEVVQRLAGEGFIMDVPAGFLVTREGYSEREMYVVLDGAFEALAGDRRLRLMGRGELFGEVAFFSRTGKRSATIRALTEGRLLVLRGNALAKMIRKDPATAAQILLGIGGILADRLATVSVSEPEPEG